MSQNDDGSARLLDRKALIEADIAELRTQARLGEIDAATASELELRYLADLEAVAAELSPPAGDSYEVDDQTPEPSAQVAEPASLRRLLIGAIVVVTVLTGGVWWLADRAFPDLEEPARPASSVGLEVSPADAEAVAGLSLDELAAVVSAHPETNALRLSFADRLLESGRRQEALEEYLVVADNLPTDAEGSHALARIGYLAYVTGQADASVDYLRQSLQRNERNQEARLFLGLVLLYGYADPEALDLLEEVAAIPDLPEDVRQQVETALIDGRNLEDAP